MKTIKLKNGVELNLTEEQEKELLDQLEKKKGRFKPEIGEEYHFISPANGGILTTYNWEGDDYDNFNYLIGNVYRTEEEAQEALKTGWVARLQAEQRIKDYILKKGYDAGDSNKYNYFIYYSSFWSGNSGLDVGFDASVRFTNLRFKDRQEAEDTLEHCKEDYKILLGVE